VNTQVIAYSQVTGIQHEIKISKTIKLIFDSIVLLRFWMKMEALCELIGRSLSLVEPDKGRVETQKLIHLMPEVFHIMMASMSLNDKLHVLAFLKQMNAFHENRLKTK
jgi:hypothetical protein